MELARERQDGSTKKQQKRKVTVSCKGWALEACSGIGLEKVFCMSPFIESLFLNRCTFLLVELFFVYIYMAIFEFRIWLPICRTGKTPAIPYHSLTIGRGAYFCGKRYIPTEQKIRKTRKRWSLTATGDARRKEGGVSWDKDGERIDGVSTCYAVVRISLSKFIICFEPDPQRHWMAKSHTFPLFGI